MDTEQQITKNNLPAEGLVRLSQIIGVQAKDKDGKAIKGKFIIPPIVPVGKSTWWEGVKKGVYPQPIKLSKRITAWRVEDIRALITNLGEMPNTSPAP